MPLKMPNGVMEEMKSDVKAYNNCLTDEYFNTLTPRQILGFTHPYWREEYTKKLEKLELI